MALSIEKIELISEEVIKVLHSRFQSFPSDATKNRNAPFHEAFLNAFKNKCIDMGIKDIPIFISMSSCFMDLILQLVKISLKQLPIY